MAIDVEKCLRELAEIWPPQSVTDITRLYEPCCERDLREAESAVTPLERQLAAQMGVSEASLVKAKVLSAKEAHR